MKIVPLSLFFFPATLLAVSAFARTLEPSLEDLRMPDSVVDSSDAAAFGLSSAELELWMQLSPEERREMLKQDPHFLAKAGEFVARAVAGEVVSRSIEAAKATREFHHEVRREQMESRRGFREGPHLKVTPEEGSALGASRFDPEA